MAAADTITHLLDAAQTMVQARGYNAFSYKDLASEVGIRTASIHYHFPAKADLGAALIQRYREALDAALAEIDRRGRSAKGKLKSFIALYRATEERGAVCLCGSLAADRASLPGEVQVEVAAYIDRSEAWVRETLTEGVRAGEFELGAKPADEAASLVAGLQGALVLSRARGGEAVVDRIQRAFFAHLRRS